MGTLQPNSTHHPLLLLCQGGSSLAAQAQLISLSHLGNDPTRDPSPPGSTAKQRTVCLAQGWMLWHQMLHGPGVQPTRAPRGLCPPLVFPCVSWSLCKGLIDGASTQPIGYTPCTRDAAAVFQGQKLTCLLTVCQVFLLSTKHAVSNMKAQSG